MTLVSSPLSLHLHMHATSLMALSSSQGLLQEALAADMAALVASEAAQHHLMDLPQPSLLGAGLTLLLDLKKAKATNTREERAHFVLDVLGVPPKALAAAFVVPITAHFLKEFLPEQESAYHTALCRLHAGVPWRRPAAA